MKVKELIELLNKCNEELQVCVSINHEVYMPVYDLAYNEENEKVCLTDRVFEVCEARDFVMLVGETFKEESVPG